MTYVHGTTKIRGHCSFRWHEREPDGGRIIEIEPHHCEACVSEVRRRSNTKLLVPDRWPSGTRPPPERVGGEVPVLVVDDDDDSRAATCELLEANGYATTRARDGREALALLADVHGACVVVLDLSMPVMDGREVLRWMREYGWSNVPVIVVSGDALKAKPEGCDLYLRKPVTPASLLAAVHLYARRARRQGAAGR